jgi:flagellar hook protein FlgE
VTFSGDGSVDTIMGKDETDEPDPRLQITVGWANGAADMDGSESSAISLFLGNYNSKDGLQQLAGDYQLNYISQNGNKFGNFAGVQVGEDGIVTALFDNGVTTPIFMIPIASFVNPNGMSALTGNVFQQTDTSGLPTVREAGTAGAGSIAGAALESSTVDLGEEFTSMITTQRAYSAAAKIITTADEMLDELVRIKR